MAQAFNVTYSFVPASAVIANELGLREAAISLLRNGKVDIVTRPTSFSIFFCSSFDCSIPMYIERVELMVPWPKEESQTVAPVRPFQNEVWIWLPISIVLVSLTLFMVQKYYTKRNNQNGASETPAGSKLWNFFVYVVAGEGDWTGWSQLSFRLVQGAWCLAAFVLVNAYCSTLISYLVSPRLMPVAKTFEDITSGSPQKLKLLAEKNEIVAMHSLRVTSGPWKGLGDLLRRYPESLFTDREKGFEQMFSGEYAYIGTERRIDVFMSKALKKAGYCKFTVSNENFQSMLHLIWMFQKNWRYTDAFNHRMGRLAESGLAYFWLRRIKSHTKSCKINNQRDDDLKKVLALNDLSGPFILLSFGLSLSLLVFLIEKIYYKFKLRYSRRTIITI